MPFVTDGVVAVICVGDHELTVAVVVPNLTVPVVEPKFLPAMTTFTPDCPLVGPIEPICGVDVPSVNCQTATVCAGRVNVVTGLFPPDHVLTVIDEPPSRPLK